MKKFGYFDNFSGKSHVKFGHFVNFSYIFFGQKCRAPLKMTQLLYAYAEGRSAVVHVGSALGVSASVSASRTIGC